MTSVIIHTEQLYHDQQVPIDYLIKKKKKKLYPQRTE